MKWEKLLMNLFIYRTEGFRLKILLTAVFSLLFFSCVALPDSDESGFFHVPSGVEESPAWMWNNLPINGNLVFIAAGPRMGNREEEAYSALENAAVQAGVFSGFWGASQDLVDSNVHGTDTNTRTHAYYNGPAADEALRRMDADKIWRNDEATWVRFILSPDRLIPQIDWVPEYIGNEPLWIRRMPEIPGWRVSVGMGGFHSSLIKTLKASDASALAAMIDLIHGSNRSITQSVEAGSETWYYSSGSHATYDRGFGDIYGFLVIARWLDDSGNSWSLAVCPEAENPIR